LVDPDDLGPGLDVHRQRVPAMDGREALRLVEDVTRHLDDRLRHRPDGPASSTLLALAEA
jgi:hypothetical protein